MTTQTFYRTVMETEHVASREAARHVTAAVFHALRNQLQPTEADHVAAQLPVELIEAKTVREVMTTNPITVRPDTTIRDLLTTFETHDVNMLPVVDGRGVVQGLVTKLDLLRIFRLQLRHWIPDLRFFWAERVEDIMSRGAIDVAPDDPVVVAIDTMIDARVRSLPVVEPRREGRVLVGIVSRTDVLPCLIVQRDDSPSAPSGAPVSVTAD